MAADSTLINAAFKEAESRYGGDVIDRSAEYTSNVATTRQALGLITGVMDEMAVDEKGRKVGRDQQLGEFEKKAKDMWDKLYSQKENLPDKFIDAIENSVKELQEEFELVNTYGKGDTAENEKKRRQINGNLQRLINSAVNTRGSYMALYDKIRNVNAEGVYIQKFDGLLDMMDLPNIQNNDNITVEIGEDYKIRITNRNYIEKKETFGGLILGTPEFERVSYSGERSMTASEIGDLFPPINREIDGTWGEDHAIIKTSGTSHGTNGVRDFDEDFHRAAIEGDIRTKEQLQQVVGRSLTGVGGLSVRDELMQSGDIAVEVIQNMFIDEDGERMEIGAIFAGLDRLGDNGAGDGRITEEDSAGLTGYDLEMWKKNYRNLIDALTDIDHPAFNLGTSRAIVVESFLDKRKQTYDDAYSKAYEIKFGTPELTPTRKANIAQFQKAISGGGVVPAGGKTYYKHDPATGTFELYDGNISSTIPKSQGYTWDHLKLTLGQYMSKQQLADLDKLFGEKYPAQTPPGIAAYQGGNYISQANLQEGGSLD